MAHDRKEFSHNKYAQRLAEIDKREKERVKRHAHFSSGQPEKPIGSKLPKLKKQRVDRTTIRATFLIVFFIIIIGVMGFIVSPYSKINKITISGNDTVTDKQVLRATSITKQDFMWNINKKSSEIDKKATKQNPEIKKITVSVTGFRSIKVQVTENKIIGSVYKNGKYYPVLSSGYILNNSQASPMNDVAVYSGFKSKQVIIQTAKQYAKLSNSIKSGVSEVKFQPTKNDPQRLRIFMNDGNEVLVKYTNLADKMAYYPGIVSQMSGNGIVNLEVGAYSHTYN